MKQGIICKSAEPAEITEEQLAKLNRYTRRPLTREEVFIFPLVLCDNEIDRDGDRFPTAALEKLAGLFLGKTGVFDHAPTAENQAARIFDTAVEETDSANSLGGAYRRLKAWAYMARCEKNADLILEIDAGIKKEVSVGCAVDSIQCSLCGADQRGAGCAHKKGEVYGGAPCHHLLLDPTDAYEWSFVAVPAQKNAGVTKRTHSSGEAAPACVPIEKNRLARLEELAALGQHHEAELRRDVVKLGLLAQPDLPPKALADIAAKLNHAELTALRKTFAQTAAQKYPLTPQLAPVTPLQDTLGNEFRI